MTALVTGASGGLGRAIAVALAEAGHDVAVHYRSDHEGALTTADLVADAGTTAMVVPHDLANDPAPLLDAVSEGLGPVDVIVANAFPQDHGTDLATWDLLWRDGLRATAALLAAAAGHKPRVIVTIGSIEGLRAMPGHTPYAVAKAALHHLTAAAAWEYGPRGIRVVGVAPGLIDRPGLAQDWPDGVDRFAAASALHRTVTPVEVAAAVVFLASPVASGITGITIPVDAGWSAAPGW